VGGEEFPSSSPTLPAFSWRGRLARKKKKKRGRQGERLCWRILLPAPQAEPIKEGGREKGEKEKKGKKEGFGFYGGDNPATLLPSPAMKGREKKRKKKRKEGGGKGWTT